MIPIDEQIHNCYAFLAQLDIGGDEFEMKLRDRITQVIEDLKQEQW